MKFLGTFVKGKTLTIAAVIMPEQFAVHFLRADGVYIRRPNHVGILKHTL